jgi:hypothetical protein
MYDKSDRMRSESANALALVVGGSTFTRHVELRMPDAECVCSVCTNLRVGLGGGKSHFDLKDEKKSLLFNERCHNMSMPKTRAKKPH